MHLDYRLDLIDRMIELYFPSFPSPKAGRPPTKAHPHRITERHFSELIPPTENKANPTRKCAVCSLKYASDYRAW
ncbi:hypothetical protein J437_LFUL008120 [Ladona fulva]|uniref:Uncharacterized protein n=1 Tax=Ladona fulva TaxID=123851 RepID=A0A8K0NS65_LADFU|nr:hypothetical protein J437_LFUL008120 [Ladona fulva]